MNDNRRIKRNEFVEVPDLRIWSHLPLRKRQPIYTHRLKSVPIIGPVTQVRWLTSRDFDRPGEGAEITSGIIRKLSQAAAIVEKMNLIGFDIFIKADPRRRRWVLFDYKSTAVTRPIWDCYQPVARSLLDLPLPSNK